jgi:uncharacterized protein (TIGR00255 family)
MTGYGRGETQAGEGVTITVEVRSSNHRFLETNVKSQREAGFLEDRVRKEIQECLFRGRVDAVLIFRGGAQARKVIVDKPLAMAYYRALEGLERDFGGKRQQLLAYVASLPGVLSLEEEVPDLEALWSCTKVAVGQALRETVAMREREGLVIASFLQERCDALERLIGSVSLRSPTVVEEYRAKMERRLSEVLPGGSMDETRLAMEIALMAERADIQEEISRALSHLGQFRATLDGEEGVVGRKLEFILQELHREVNTIGSKAGDYAIASMVVEAKAELERMREQVQNVE